MIRVSNIVKYHGDLHYSTVHRSRSGKGQVAASFPSGRPVAEKAPCSAASTVWKRSRRQRNSLHFAHADRRPNAALAPRSCNFAAPVGMVFQQFNLFPHMTRYTERDERPGSRTRECLPARRNRDREEVAGSRRVGRKSSPRGRRTCPAASNSVLQSRSAFAVNPAAILFDEPTMRPRPKDVGGGDASHRRPGRRREFAGRRW